MIREFIGHLHWSALPVISMVLFMGVFVGALLWVFRKESGEVYSELSLLPLVEKGDSK
jgi:cbb3-type cytochrome oxidase subunit 3